MKQEKNILDKVYESAKAKRIVLTQDEFAKLIGTSRASLHRYRNGEPIPQQLTQSALALLDESLNVSHETIHASEPVTPYINQRRHLKNTNQNTLMYCELPTHAKL